MAFITHSAHNAIFLRTSVTSAHQPVCRHRVLINYMRMGKKRFPRCVHENCAIHFAQSLYIAPQVVLFSLEKNEEVTNSVGHVVFPSHLYGTLGQIHLITLPSSPVTHIPLRTVEMLIRKQLRKLQRRVTY